MTLVQGAGMPVSPFRCLVVGIAVTGLMSASPGAARADAAIANVSAGFGADLAVNFPYAVDWHTPGGNPDMVFSLTINVPGAHTTTRVDVGADGGWWWSSEVPGIARRRIP